MDLRIGNPVLKKDECQDFLQYVKMLGFLILIVEGLEKSQKSDFFMK